MAIFGMPPGAHSDIFGVKDSPLFATLVAAALTTYCSWQVWILHRKNVIDFFQAAQRERLGARAVNQRTIKPRQFSLSTLFLITLLAAFAMWRVCADDVQYVESNQSQSIRNGSSGYRNLRYGVKSSRFLNRPDQLTYVLFYDANDRVRQTMQSGRGKPSSYFTTPDGQEISSSSPHQLYEIVDGRTRWRAERITLEELMKYVDTHTADWNLEALVRHAEESRVGK
jgi:hypothetical protein